MSTSVLAVSLFLCGQASPSTPEAVADLGFKFSGWADGSFTGSSARYSQLPMGLNYRANEFLLQQFWLRAEKEVERDSGEPSFGFRCDAFFGSDYRFTVARGLFDRQLTDNNGMPATYGVDPVQFYGEAYFPDVAAGLDVKFGRFFAQFGAESIASTQNALASLSYSCVYDPYTHTGVLGTLQLNDTWSVQSGLVLGSDVFVDPAARPTYIGSVKWAPKDGTQSLLLSTVLGPGRYDLEQRSNNPQILDAVYTFKPTKEWAFTFEGLFGWQDRVPGIGSATWYGVVGYLTYSFSETLSATGRLEFFDDVDGSRTTYKGLYTAGTLGVTWKATKALWLRPEVRFDSNSESNPFNGRSSLLTAAMSAVLLW